MISNDPAVTPIISEADTSSRCMQTCAQLVASARSSAKKKGQEKATHLDVDGLRGGHVLEDGSHICAATRSLHTFEYE